MKKSEVSKKKSLEVMLSANGRSASFKLGWPGSMEALSEVIQLLWRTMEEPSIRFVQKTPQINIDPDFLRSPEKLDGSYKFACPFDCKDHKNCPDYLPNGKCSFGRHTPEQLAIAPQCPVATDKHKTNS